MQLLLIRNAQPQTTALGGASEPNLSYDGNEQARRLPDALSKFNLARIVSSPQLPALQTAAPVAAQLRMKVDVDERFAESDSDPGTFVRRVLDGIEDLVAAGEHDQTLAVFTHRGVINAVIHSVLRTEEFFSIEPDFAGWTRLTVSDSGELSVASVNVTEHVWDILYRTQWWTEEH